MIDQIKNIVFTILNKEKRGPITPSQFIDSCIKNQAEIFAGYFDSEIIRAKNREARGMANDSVKLYEQRLAPFYVPDKEITGTDGVFTLPSDCYFIDRRGVFSKDVSGEYRTVDILKPSLFKRENPSTVFPAGYVYGNNIKVSPETITKIHVDYYSKPKDPNWTYSVSNGVAYFNPSNSDYQDFELHISEESNLITGILSDFGIIKREADMTQLINTIKQAKDNGSSRLL